MGLSEALFRFAATAPRPLVVAVPGGTAVRLAAERELRLRGRRPALAPAQANLLVLCGEPAGALEAAAQRVWEQIPAPRARVEVRLPGDMARLLDEAAESLAHRDDQRAQAAVRRRAQPTVEAEAAEGGGGHDHHHGHHGEMALPGGLAMADRAPDRDGLKLDRLHVTLGPVLNDWPAGLVLRVALQGDVIQEARADVSMRPADGTAFWDEPWHRLREGDRVSRGELARRRAAAHLDSLGRLLGVAGWEGPAWAARGLRDDLLTGAGRAAIVPRFARFARRAGRSRLLRAMTDGLGVIDAEAATAHGITGPASRAAASGGDVTARWRVWLAETAEALDDLESSEPGTPAEGPRGSVAERRAPSESLLSALPSMVNGAELAAARLIVASLDPDLDGLSDRAAAEAAAHE
ncbi:hypothetical protein ACGFNU_35760 [Spirillospora sp. NPDC048911]|uniref:hypothetical protein n=1 Tax=Spirillospora sp. NPDC048911 TaxID=3364527 RepID=UPI00371025E8